MNRCPSLADRPGHERPYRCRYPEGHAWPHTYTDPPVSAAEGSERLAWNITEMPDE